VETARARLRELTSTVSARTVLHGDLHHDNLLWSDERQAWVAIDPHGVVGDRGYDVGALLINPWRDAPADRVARRLDILREMLGEDRDRLAAWGLVRAVLAEAWTVQVAGHPDGRPLSVAEALLGQRTSSPTRADP
jgi:streptomycin 6-kinase